MLYTVGDKQSYDAALERRRAEHKPLNKRGKFNAGDVPDFPEDYGGGVVFLSVDQALSYIKGYTGYHVYGVLTDQKNTWWDNHARQYRLVADAEIVAI